MKKRYYYKTSDEKGFLSLKTKDTSGKYIKITKEEFEILTRSPEEIEKAEEVENNSLWTSRA